MGFLDRFVDTEKTSKMEVKSPRDIYYGILKNTSGTAYTRKMDVDIFYTVYGFKGVTEGVGCSTLVANVAQAIADMGLTVCVIDTSILSPVQDILLKTDVEYDVQNTYDSNVAEKRLDWFDMPYEKKSVLHLSKINQNISVLSFKGKKRTIIDFLSTNDSETLVEMALSELHTKFDIILVDICHEPSAVATACLQQSQKIIQVWNDAPTVLGNLERFITNSVTLACPMDKMSNVVYSKVQRDALGSLDNVLKEYKFKKVGVNYFSEEVALQAVIGNNLFQLPSNDKNVIAYTDCVIDVACLILNLTADREQAKVEASNKKGKNKDIIKTEDILNGKVDGTATKKLRDRERKINQDLGITPIKTLNDADASLNQDGFVDAYKEEGFITSLDEFTQSLDTEEPVDNVSSEPNMNIADDPDFSVVDLTQATEDIVEDSSDNENIEFEPIQDEEATAESDDEFAVGEFETSEEDEFTGDDFVPTTDDGDLGTISDPAIVGDEVEEPISETPESVDEFADSEFEEEPADEFVEEAPASDTEPMETIDVPEEFFDNQEEPLPTEDTSSAPIEEYNGEINEVQYEDSTTAVEPEEIQQIMGTDDSDEFADEFVADNTDDDDEFFDDGDISADIITANDNAEPISDSLDVTDDTETPISNDDFSEDIEETPTFGDFSEAEETNFEETVETIPTTEENPLILDQSTLPDESETPISEEISSEFDDDGFADDFEEDTIENNGISGEETPISEQLEPSDDTEKPISEEVAAFSEEFDDSEEFFEETPENDGIQVENTPISDAGSSGDEATKPFSESSEESFEEFSDTDALVETPTDEVKVDDTTVEEKEDEFFDMTDDFDQAPTSEGIEDDEFLTDTDKETPNSDQSEEPDEAFEPTFEDENVSDSDEFADDDEFFEDNNSTDASVTNTSEEDEFLDDDDDFFFDDDENMQALQNYVKSQNTEFKN